MMTYVLLTGIDGAPVEPALVERFGVDPPELPFDPRDCIEWRNTTGSVVLVAWQAFTEFAGIGSHWARDDVGITAFTGHCWPVDHGWNHVSGQSWGRQLRQWLSGRTDIVSASGDLFGQFHLIHLDRDGHGRIVPDWLATEPLYLAESDTVVAVSNRAGLAARAVTPPGDEATRSLTGAGWLLGYGSMLDDESGYWDVQHAPFGSHVRVHGGSGAVLVEPERSPLVPSTRCSYDEAREAIDRELRATLRHIAALPVSDLEFALSGGKDSRLLTALIIDEGLQDRFHFFTSGSPGRPDVLVAQRIAETYGLRWSLVDRTGRSASHALQEALDHTALVEAATSAWDAVGPTTFASGITVGGVAGEYLRWGGVARKGLQIERPSELVDLMRTGIGFDPLGILRDEARAYYQQSMALWAERHIGRGERLREIGSFFMQETRMRTRVGPTQAWNARLRIDPYVTRGIVQAEHGLPDGQWPDDRFQIDLMRQCDVPLSKLPFADSVWTESSIAHLPDAADYRGLRAQPAHPDAPLRWQLSGYDTYRPILEAYLLDPANPIQDLVDRDKVARRIAAGDTHPGRTRLLWGALTAAIWMGRHDQPTRIRPR